MTLLELPALSPATTALFFDIDGTLAPINDDAAQVVVNDATLELLTRACARYAMVAVVTGRSLEAARRLVPVDGIWIAANHGMHIVEPGGGEHVDPAAHAAREHLDTAVTLARTVGWRHEDKGLSVTLHFRHVATPELTARQMKAQMATVLDPRALEVRDARMSIEIRPTGARTKGDAVRWMLEQHGNDIATGVAVGDDATDSDMFEALGAMSNITGIRIAVHSDETPAALLEVSDFGVESQGDVEGLLAQLVAVG